MQAKHYITDAGSATTIDTVYTSPTAQIPRYTVWQLNPGRDQYVPVDAGNELGELGRRYGIDTSFLGTQVISRRKQGG